MTVKTHNTTTARVREVGHFYAAGLPTAGKTVLLATVIDQALARGDRLVVRDPKDKSRQTTGPK